MNVVRVAIPSHLLVKVWEFDFDSNCVSVSVLAGSHKNVDKSRKVQYEPWLRVGLKKKEMKERERKEKKQTNI